MRVVLPLQPAGADLGICPHAILGWSQFIIPFILISKPALQPIAVGIFNFQGTYIDTSTQLLAAASVLSIVPAVFVFLILQRFIIGALMAGAVKADLQAQRRGRPISFTQRTAATRCSSI